MSEITLNVEGRRVKVDEAFLRLSPKQQEATVNEIAASLGPKDDSGLMGQLNQGIANSAGGIIDLINPFDKPHALNPFKEGTGSAKTGIEAGMDAIGVNRATTEPDTLMENFARGAGEAAGAAPIGGAVAKALSGAGGLLGSIADDASQAMNTTRGVVSEMFAGGGAQAGAGLAEDAGAPEWVQQTAAIAGGAGVGAIPGAVRSTPSAIGARKLTSAVKTAAMPYTNAGGKEVARQRLQELAGGPERAAELARRVGPTEIGLTPAQQTGDQNLLGLEQEAMRRDPNLRARIEQQTDQGKQVAAQNIRSMGGDPADAQAFFNERRKTWRDKIVSMVDRATDGALRPTVKNSEMINSQEVSEKIKAAESAARVQEADLWARVPRDTRVGTTAARQKAQALIAQTPKAQRDDIPRVVQELLGPSANNGFDEFETVGEMHGLYSKLREVARSARSGNDQQRNMARIADEVADAVLDDLGAGAGVTDAGKAIDNARAFSAEMHEVFSQGVVGKLLKRSIDGGRSIDPGLTLNRSLGRGGATGAVGADDIQKATGSSADSQMEDFVTGLFNRSAFGADGTFNQRGALSFMRDNGEMLQRFPYLRDTLDEAIRTQTRASNAADRGARALQDANSPAKSITAAFTQGPSETAIDTVFKAKRPSVAARELVATARKDPSGKAMDGLKGSFADYVIRKSTDANGLNGEAMLRLLDTPETAAILRAALPNADLNRIKIIGNELRKLREGRKAAPDIGGLSPRSPNRLIEMAARVIAAKQGAKMGGGSSGASIQTANMASNRMKGILGNLQNDKAEKLLIDAVSDPELFRLLLVDPGSVKLTPKQSSRLAPYFAGTAAAMGTE
ncbi:hypothetical protein [Sulfitobacter sp. 1A12157]|uniref:hypothetical protein n=1 Tax=Sulfitobacter sp. 1A12157 TaxID=3368594 RepID=UPI00374743F2